MNRYEQLFKEYVSEMRRSMNAANKWWEKLEKRELSRTKNREKALQQIEERWPFGPASHPYVLGTYRKYFLACERLNKELEDREEQEAVESRDDEEDDWGVDEEEEDDEQDSFGDVEQPIPAWNLLIDRLSGRYDELRDFLAQMVYAPIGVDDKDNFV